MSVGGEAFEGVEDDVGAVLEEFGVDDVERLEDDAEAVLTDANARAELKERTEEKPPKKSEKRVESEVEALFDDLGTTTVQRVEETDTESDPRSSDGVEVFVSDPTVDVSTGDGAAIDELFEDVEQSADEDAGLVGTVDDRKRVGDDSFGTGDDRKRVANDSFGTDDDQYEDELSEPVADALAEAEAELDRYRSNPLYDAHPDETAFEWVSLDDLVVYD